MGEENPKESSDKAAPRPVNKQALAAMLRECAGIVERGEFDPILYTALQDFRTYYKAHYPKKKEKSSSSRKRTPKKKATTSDSPPKADTTNDTKVSETSETKSSETPMKTKMPESHATPEVASVAESKDSSMQSGDVFEQEIVDAASAEATSTEKSGPPGAPVDSPGAGKFRGPTNEPEADNSAEPPAAKASPTSAAAAQPTAFGRKFASPSSTVQKPSAGAFLGKLKFPKMNVHMPNPAFAATSKKNAERAKEDLEAFNGVLAQHAESSQRRKAPDDASPGGEGVWCETHYTMNCACQSKTTSSTVRAGNASQPLSRSADEPAHPTTSSSTTSEQNRHFSETSKPVAAARRTSTSEASETSADSTAATKEKPADPHTATKADMAQENAKPDFQRPVNVNSSLVANGWIEQHRRSKMRHVWKEVLASLVQARKPGEETTLWIQRETSNPITGKKELEALHQIPVKLLEKCTYLDYTPDNRFTLRVYNAPEEFTFRCRTDIAAMNWVRTLQKHERISKGLKPNEKTTSTSTAATSHTSTNGTNPFEDEKKVPDSNTSQRMTISELRAICHGAGINTAGMERGQLEAAAEEVRKRGTYFPAPTNNHRTQTPPPSGGLPTHIPPPQPASHEQAPTNQPAAPSSQPAAESHKLSISELRAICHGAGINTAGMERGQLEAAAEEVRQRGTYFPPPPSGGVPQAPPAPTPAAHEEAPKISIKELRAICHGAGINTVGMERSQLEAAAEQVRQRGTYFDPPAQSAAPSQPHAASSEARRHQEEETKRREAEEQRRRAEEYNRQRMEEEHRRRAAEEDHRRRMEEEHRRRLAEEDHRRRMAEQQAAEQQRRFAEQQAQWQKQQQEEEQRRRMAEQQAAEQRRRQEEAVRKQQQWHQQQQQQQAQQQWHQQQQAQQQWHQQQQAQQQWHQQQQQAHHQQQQQHHGAPPPQHHHHQQQQQQQQSAASQKYAKMANQSEDDGQAAITRIKHEILIHWALQPPQLQMLRPIDALVTTIHNVFPPALNVVAHEYFKKWKAFGRSDVCNDAGLVDDEKLKKAVRKIRFFLHPDKLPKDLNAEQSFMVKMLWDITSDAWEEFQKRKEDLDWIK